MKRIKFITAIIVIVITLVFIGEIYVWHIDSFETNYPHTTMYLQKDSTPQKMIDDINLTAAQYDVEVFTIVNKIESLFSEHIFIYATQGAIPIIEDEASIKAGKFSSIFLGEVEITILPFDDISDISSVESYYMIGDNNNIIQFKQALVNLYAGRYPEFPETTNENMYFIGICWFVAFGLLLLLTLYEIAFTKKEIMIRIILGERLDNIIKKHVLIDNTIYIAIFILSIIILNQFSNILYLLELTAICFVVFLSLNSVLYLMLYHINYKKDIATNSSAIAALSASYALKVVTAVLVVLVISGGIAVVIQGIDFYRQMAFFEEHSDYSYLTVSADEFDQTIEINRSLYKTASDKNKTISLVNLGYWEYAEYVLANHGAIDYLTSATAAIETIPLEEKVYFLLSEKDAQNEEINVEMIEVWESYYKGKYKYEVIVYKNDTNILTIENIGRIRSTILSNPVIILDNTHTSNIDDYWNIGYIANSTLYHYTDTEWETYIRDHGLSNELYYSTNAYDNYIYQWEFAKRNLYASAVLMLLLLIMESIIILTILRFEYNVNAIELSLKKVFGHTLYARQKKLLFMTFITYTVGIAVAIVLCRVLDIAPVFTILLGGFLVVLSEIIFIIFNVRRVEKRNIQRILKGEYI